MAKLTSAYILYVADRLHHDEAFDSWVEHQHDAYGHDYEWTRMWRVKYYLADRLSKYFGRSYYWGMEMAKLYIGTYSNISI